MFNVHNVAKHIMNILAPDHDKDHVTSWKLQKLVYYCQAWSLVWDERQLFQERIEAWADGPVCPDLYEQHKGRFILRNRDIEGNPNELDSDATETIEAVLEYYGNKTGRYLSDLTHMELPWIEARSDTPLGARSNAEISCESMAEYYGGL